MEKEKWTNRNNKPVDATEARIQVGSKEGTQRGGSS
jgi:hypothetical protein